MCSHYSICFPCSIGAFVLLNMHFGKFATKTLCQKLGPKWSGRRLLSEDEVSPCFAVSFDPFAAVCVGGGRESLKAQIMNKVVFSCHGVFSDVA